ncbi:unnamed protein product [Chironomus riparius]|uniref:Uncharacterized protein n=1 Tax=Chironomus riparius TaxID=315576 RepID=A0A9N9S7Z5_9DIPT|nr:unnamed protein product [Chironomus riparius]CAG9811493.1 unnamed protein product [Chironomus riparius]
MSAKIIILCSLLISSTYGFRFPRIFDAPMEVAPHIVCTGVADGTKLPDDTDCGHFFLCDGGASLRLACRLSEPHFDRCAGACINDPSVCTVTDCPGSTESSTTESTTTTTTTTSTTTTTTTTTPAPSDSTTKFNPPTVPTVCSTPCETTWDVATCECIEKWVCENDVCVCNPNNECPLTEAECILPENCGCMERCDCPETDKCSCVTDGTQCPFDDIAGACIKNCGCQSNCICTDTTAATGCTCNPTCTCNEPPKVCPFKPADCLTNCACDERCNCNGDFCTCNADVACPASFWKRLY